MAAAQKAENHGDGYSQNSLVAAEALSLMMSSHGTSLKWSWRPSQSAVYIYIYILIYTCIYMYWTELKFSKNYANAP